MEFAAQATATPTAKPTAIARTIVVFVESFVLYVPP
jgi:hypothetical protein